MNNVKPSQEDIEDAIQEGAEEQGEERRVRAHSDLCLPRESAGSALTEACLTLAATGWSQDSERV